MTAWVVNTRVVIGGQTIILSSMGMLHIKTQVFGVRNVKSGLNLGMRVVMTAWVINTRVTTLRPKLTLDLIFLTSITYVHTCNMPISLYQIFLKSTVYEIASQVKWPWKGMDQGNNFCKKRYLKKMSGFLRYWPLSLHRKTAKLLNMALI